jgi:hypothetical protein
MHAVLHYLRNFDKMAKVTFSSRAKVTVKITQLAESSNCMQRGSSFEIPLGELRLKLKNGMRNLRILLPSLIPLLITAYPISPI